MSVDIQEPRKSTEAEIPAPPAARPPLMERVRAAFAEVAWPLIFAAGFLMAFGWFLFYLSPSWLQLLAGIVPVMTGLYVGRKVRGQYLLNGIMLGLIGFVFSLLLLLSYGAAAQSGVAPMPLVAFSAEEQPRPATSLTELLLFYLPLGLLALLPFPAFGTVMAGRAEQRNAQLRKEVEDRGGRLERPGVVRTLEDLQGLSLPQLGSYVVGLYKKKGFEFRDYRFIDKDKHLDLELVYNGEIYLLRLSVADKVRPGTVESLVQEMKRRGIPKGLTITSTEFTPDALRSAKGRRNILAIDGQTLFDMAQG